MKNDCTYGDRWELVGKDVVVYDCLSDSWRNSVTLNKDDLLAMLAALEDFEQESFDE